MKENEIVNELRKSWKNVYVWKDKPSEYYDKHAHDFDTKIIIVEGNMELTLDGEKHELIPNSEIIIRKNQVHEARVGFKGCKYIVAEQRK